MFKIKPFLILSFVKLHFDSKVLSCDSLYLPVKILDFTKLVDSPDQHNKEKRAKDTNRAYYNHTTVLHLLLLFTHDTGVLYKERVPEIIAISILIHFGSPEISCSEFKIFLFLTDCSIKVCMDTWFIRCASPVLIIC